MRAGLVLASGSPRRETLLRQIGLEFEMVPSGVDESPPDGASPREVAEELALAKARHVASGRASGLVIGADTVVVLGDLILGKPSGPDDAAGMLRTLSGPRPPGDHRHRRGGRGNRPNPVRRRRDRGEIRPPGR